MNVCGVTKIITGVSYSVGGAVSYMGVLSCVVYGILRPLTIYYSPQPDFGFLGRDLFNMFRTCYVSWVLIGKTAVQCTTGGEGVAATLLLSCWP